jgi:uncharacterized FlaG/YvyC family protein
MDLILIANILATVLIMEYASAIKKAKQLRENSNCNQEVTSLHLNQHITTAQQLNRFASSGSLAAVGLALKDKKLEDIIREIPTQGKLFILSMLNFSYGIFSYGILFSNLQTPA